MGNTGIRKLFFPGEFCETKYHNIFEFSLMDLDRNEIFLEKYKGFPCLIVNVASENKESVAQIEELKEIANKYQGKLQVLAFPSNQFGNEPQGFEQIKKIYFEQFKINFPLFAKVEVNGEYSSTFFKYLKRHSFLFSFPLLSCKPIDSDFCKFLLTKEGEVHRYYEKAAKKQDIVKEIDALLNKA